MYLTSMPFGDGQVLYSAGQGEPHHALAFRGFMGTEEEHGFSFAHHGRRTGRPGLLRQRCWRFRQATFDEAARRQGAR